MTSTPTASTKRRRTQAERTQETQQKLVRGAIVLLKQKRYTGFRTADVAEVAGVSKGAQTHHFPSKDMLVLEALEEVYRQTLVNAEKRIAQAKASPGQLIDLLVADSEAFFLSDDFLLTLDLMMVDPQSPLGVGVKELASALPASLSRRRGSVHWLTLAMTRPRCRRWLARPTHSPGALASDS
ncbi:TetR/AcrR family transcriptional regulator [Cupriavidus basilensis]